MLRQLPRRIEETVFNFVDWQHSRLKVDGKVFHTLLQMLKENRASWKFSESSVELRIQEVIQRVWIGEIFGFGVSVLRVGNFI